VLIRDRTATYDSIQQNQLSFHKKRNLTLKGQRDICVPYTKGGRDVRTQYPSQNKLYHVDSRRKAINLCWFLTVCRENFFFAR